MRKKKWVTPFLDSEAHYLLREPLKENDVKIYNKIYLEVGMGMGDFITESASLHPDYLYIGFEKDETCVARAIKKAIEMELSNLLIIKEDASNLSSWFEVKVDGIYLQFSDPWPKKGHAKRRLTSSSFLNEYDKVLKDGAQIIFKTDNEGLFEYSLVSFDNSNFRLEEVSLDRHKTINDDILTGYERRFMGEGKRIFYARYKKGNA